MAPEGRLCPREVLCVGGGPVVEAGAAWDKRGGETGTVYGAGARALLDVGYRVYVRITGETLWEWYSFNNFRFRNNVNVIHLSLVFRW